MSELQSSSGLNCDALFSLESTSLNSELGFNILIPSESTKNSASGSNLIAEKLSNQISLVLPSEFIDDQAIVQQLSISAISSSSMSEAFAVGRAETHHAVSEDKDLLTGQPEVNPTIDGFESQISAFQIATEYASGKILERSISQSLLVGVIDTGFSTQYLDIDSSHIILGFDYVDNDGNPLLEPEEINRHGTSVLSAIAAVQSHHDKDSELNPQIAFWLSRAVGSGHWADALTEFVDTARVSGQSRAVVNLSFDLIQVDLDGTVSTRYELTPDERAAIAYAHQFGILIVAAAGNQGNKISALGQASQEFDNIITVGAAQGLHRANYSSFGKGLDILTPGNASSSPDQFSSENEYSTLEGTSIAAARVTGAITQIWSANPELSNRQIIQILKATATDLEIAGWDEATGSGLLNVSVAIDLAKATLPETQKGEFGITPPIGWYRETQRNISERAAEAAGAGDGGYGYGDGSSGSGYGSDSSDFDDNSGSSGSGYGSDSSDTNTANSNFESINYLSGFLFGLEVSIEAGKGNFSYGYEKMMSIGNYYQTKSYLTQEYQEYVEYTDGYARGYNAGPTAYYYFRGQGAYPNDLVQQWKFKSNLIKAVQLSSLENLKHSPVLGQSLLELSDTYAMLQPYVFNNSEDTPLSLFLDTLWNAQDEVKIQKSANELKTFFNYFDQEENGIQFLSNILNAIENLPQIENDPEALHQFMELANSYIELQPQSSSEVNINFFLNTLLNAKDSTELQQGIEEFNGFLKGFEHPTQLLKLEHNLLEALAQTPSLQQQKQDVQFIAHLLDLGREYAIIALASSPTVNPSQSGNDDSKLFLNTLWQSSDLQKGGEEFSQFLERLPDPNKTVKFLKNLLEVFRLTPGLPQAFDSTSITQLIEIGTLYSCIENSSTEIPQNFSKILFNTFNADNEGELEKIAGHLYSLVNNTPVVSIGLSQFSIDLSSTNLLDGQVLKGSYANAISQALVNGSEAGNQNLLSTYHVYHILNPPPDGRTYSENYVHTVESSYNLVWAEGQIRYYSQGTTYSVEPGNVVLQPVESIAPSTIDLLLNSQAQFLADTITELQSFNRMAGQFVLGAIYQFSVNQSAPLRELLSLNPEVQQWLENAEAGSEEALQSQPVAFQAGRLFGDGAAIVVGLLEFVAGVSTGIGGSAGGASLCLTGVGCIAGAPAIAVSLATGAALTVQGAGAIIAGLQGIAEQTLTLLAITSNSGAGSFSSGDPVPGIRGATFGRSRNNSNQANIDYEVRVTGKGSENQDLAVFVDRSPGTPGNPVEFDWFDGTTLVDAKNYTLDNPLIRPGVPEPVRNSFRSRLVDEAERQIDAMPQSSATRVEWRVATDEMRQVILDIFDDEGITGIDVVLYE